MSKSHDIEPIRGTKGATVLGPRNHDIEKQNPDLIRPPETDNGGIPYLKFPFSMAHNRLEEGAGHVKSLNVS